MALQDEVVKYLRTQKSQGKTCVYRHTIFAVMCYLGHIPNTPKALPRGVLVEAAKACGGAYIVRKRRSSVVF